MKGFEIECVVGQGQESSAGSMNDDRNDSCHITLVCLFTVLHDVWTFQYISRGAAICWNWWYLVSLSLQSYPGHNLPMVPSDCLRRAKKHDLLVYNPY